MNSITKDTVKHLFKISTFAILDALVVWASITLFSQQLYKLLAFLLVGAILLNFVYLSKKAYPLRYILPGTIFMILLIIYPLFYTCYISFTNYGTGNILSKQQVIDQLESNYILPEDPDVYNFQAFNNPDDGYIILFSNSEGNLLLGRNNTIVDISKNDNRLKDTDGDGEVDQFNDLKALDRATIFKNLSRLQKLEYEYNDKILRMQDFSSFAEYVPQYQYNSRDDVLVDIKNNIEYYPEGGYFVSESGDRLLPGFRTPIGWRNFKRLLTDQRISGPFFRVFIWTVIWATLSVITTFCLGLLMAIFVNDEHIRFRTLYRILLILPYAIPTFISAMVWRGLFDTEVGVINQIIESIFGSGIPWLIDPIWARVALIIVNLWLGFPYMMLIALGSLQSIPNSYYEAAAIDGASLWQQFRHITFPLLMVSMAPVLIASFAFNFNNFTVIYLFNRGRPAIPNAQTPAGATDILISYTYRLSFESGRGADFGLASAVTILIFIITATITWFNFRYTGALEDVKENV
ncbi:MAG: maltose ABC transporter permease MalF [Halanaerobiales bacterium]